MCNCLKEFQHKAFGLAHWFKYSRIRLKWRNLIARLQYQQALDESYLNFVTHRSCNKYPGPSMTKDEYEHWFGG